MLVYNLVFNVSLQFFTILFKMFTISSKTLSVVACKIFLFKSADLKLASESLRRLKKCSQSWKSYYKQVCRPLYKIVQMEIIFIFTKFTHSSRKL